MIRRRNIASAIGNVIVLDTEPTIQADGLTFSNVRKDKFTVNWNLGNGDGVLVTIKLGTDAISLPVDGTEYIAGETMGLGDNLGNNNYVVFKGLGTGMTILGLARYTLYTVRIFTYNNVDGAINYLTSTATNNPIDQRSGLS